MPGRGIPLVNKELYHIFNRGSDHRRIFLQFRDYKRFQQTFRYYQFMGPKPKFSNFAKFKLGTNFFDNNKKVVEILCYCLMPNHFHFLVRQLKDGGISQFVSQISNSYTKFFNTKYNRVGALLQGVFSAVLVETDEQLVHLSRYIHLNPLVSDLAENLSTYKWSSYAECISGQGLLCSVSEILGYFASPAAYEKFLLDQAEYGQSLERLRHKLIDF